MSYVPAAAVALSGDTTDAILQGATYYREFVLTSSGGGAFDLSPWVGASKGVRCQFRQEVGSTTVVVTPVLAILSPATDGKISITIDSVTTAAMNVDAGVFDVELYDNNVSPPTVERVITGTWSLSREVTR